MMIASQALRDTKATEDTCMPDSLSVLRFTPAMKIVGRTISKIFDRFYAVFTKGDEHSRRYTWNILQSVFNADLLWPSIKTRLNIV